MEVKITDKITGFPEYESDCSIQIGGFWYVLNWGILQIVRKYIPVGTVVTITTEDSGEILDIEEQAGE